MEINNFKVHLNSNMTGYISVHRVERKGLQVIGYWKTLKEKLEDILPVDIDVNDVDNFVAVYLKQQGYVFCY